MNRPVILLLTLLFFSIIMAGCGQKKVDTTNMPPKEVFEMKCSHCHALPSTSTYRGEDWIPLVNRMQSKNPSWIDDAEAKKIQGYLITVSSKK